MVVLANDDWEHQLRSLKHPSPIRRSHASNLFCRLPQPRVYPRCYWRQPQLYRIQRRCVLCVPKNRRLRLSQLPFRSGDDFEQLRTRRVVLWGCRLHLQLVWGCVILLELLFAEPLTPISYRPGRLPSSRLHPLGRIPRRRLCTLRRRWN